MNLIQIENKEGKVKLNEAVTKQSIDRMIEEIGRLFGASAAASGADFGVIMNAAENAVDVLELEINSPGGSVFDGYTIYQEIKSLRDRGVMVNATITGMAASMASVIVMAADKIRIVPHGRMMIHDASNVVAGNAEQLRQAAELLDGISNDLAGIYSARTGKSLEEVRDLMKKETWMSAKEAVENRFADEIFDIRAVSSTKDAIMNFLAKLLPDKAEDIAKLEAQIAENDSLRNELAEAEAKLAEISNLTQIVAEKEQEVANIAAERDQVKAELEAEKEAKAALEAELEAAKASASVQAVEILAQAGQPKPMPLEDSQVSSIIDQWNAIKDPGEAHAFYKKHRKEILAARNSQ